MNRRQPPACSFTNTRPRKRDPVVAPAYHQELLAAQQRAEQLARSAP